MQHPNYPKFPNFRLIYLHQHYNHKIEVLLSNLIYSNDSLGIDLGEITIEADCKFDRRGVLMEEEIDVPFPAITLTVNCNTTASQDELTTVGQETAKYCAIAKLFEAAGTDLTVNWVKVT